MNLLVNDYSFIVLASLLILLITTLTWHLFKPRWATAAFLITFAMLFTFQLTASTTADTVSSREELNNILSAGKPVLLELYSNF